MQVLHPHARLHRLPHTPCSYGRHVRLYTFFCVVRDLTHSLACVASTWRTPVDQYHRLGDSCTCLPLSLLISLPTSALHELPVHVAQAGKKRLCLTLCVSTPGVDRSRRLILSFPVLLVCRVPSLLEATAGARAKNGVVALRTLYARPDVRAFSRRFCSSPSPHYLHVIHGVPWGVLAASAFPAARRA